MKRVKRCLAAVLAVAMTAMFAGSCSQNGNVLKVATNAEFPPYESLNENNEIVGFDADLITMIAEKMGMKVEWQNMDFDGVVSAVSSGSCDAAISGLTINPNRQKSVDFSKPYYTGAAQILIVRQDDSVFTGTTKEELDEQLKNKTIGVCEGFTGVNYAQGDPDWPFDPIEGATVKIYTNISLAIADLKNKTVDVIIMDDTPAKKAAATDENKEAVRVIDVPLTIENYAIAVKKGNSELLEKIDKALKELQDAGEVDKLFEKWDIEVKE